VTLTAAPDANNVFTGWSGGGCSGSGSCVVTMNAAATVTATFMPLRRLDVAKAGAGTGTVTTSPSGIDCGTACASSSADYTDGAIVTMTATPDAANAFVGWSGGGCSGTGSCVVTMDAAKTVTATFSPIRRLDVLKAGTGTGTVTTAPSGIYCATACASSSADFTDGATVTLTAVPDAGNTFTGWSGGGCSGTEPCAMTISAAATVTATFMPLRRLDVAKAGSGTGTVTASPSGISSDINCGTACATDSADYIATTVVALTAAPDADNTFTGWSGGGCSGTGSCVVTMNTATTVTATFMPLRRLDVAKAGSGTGTVTASPSGIGSDINCATACATDSADYIAGAVVTLTAVPDADNIFIGWSGGGCSGTGSCVVTMNAAATATATFMPLRRLDVAKAGTGTGTVTASPLGISSDINCKTACLSDSADYIDGTTVTLTATPDAGYVFAGWFGGGGCSDAELTCVVTLNAAKSVVGMFAVKGDINLDGAVDLADVILVFQVLCRTQPPGIHRAADVNNDDRLGVADVIYLLQKAAGMR
jgi:hypothetical protein